MTKDQIRKILQSYVRYVDDGEITPEQFVDLIRGLIKNMKES